MSNRKRETTFPTRGEHRDPWELQELAEIAAIRQQITAADLRTAAIGAEWRIEQTRERRRKERDRRRSRKQTHDSRPG